jgi:hypothetical protein
VADSQKVLPPPDRTPTQTPSAGPPVTTSEPKEESPGGSNTVPDPSTEPSTPTDPSQSSNTTQTTESTTTTTTEPESTTTPTTAPATPGSLESGGGQPGSPGKATDEGGTTPTTSLPSP